MLLAAHFADGHLSSDRGFGQAIDEQHDLDFSSAK